MTVTDGDRIDRAVSAADEPAALTISRAVHGDGAERILLRRDGRTVFTCLASRRPDSTWFITECLPQRRGHGSADLLLAVCDHLAAESGATNVVTISPGFWGPCLAASGAQTLQRIVPMWLRLDEDLLGMHASSWLGDDQFAPLDMSADTPERLTVLSADDEREGDLIVWRETLDCVYGPVIAEASLQMGPGAKVRAAIAITEYLGNPLIVHLVTAAAERGGGLGRALLVESLRRLSDCGYVECRLNVVADNWVAHRLYRSVGFIQAGPELLASWISREAPGDERR